MSRCQRLVTGDCVEAMRELPDASVHAIVTDPPYGLGFMGKAWDDLPPGGEWGRECLRVLKPGGHLLAFGGSRTYHRLACAVEDAGFEVRDQMMWLYGSGFPKSLDVSKAIDKAAGADRKVLAAIPDRWAGKGQVLERSRQEERDEAFITAPATPEAEAWNGWGTALKPAHEPIVVARKPLVGTVAENVLRFGTGGLNIDGCRIDSGPSVGGSSGGKKGTRDLVGGFGHDSQQIDRTMEAGRWPANVVIDEEAGRLLDEQSGESKDGVAVQRNGGGQRIWGAENMAGARADAGFGGSGGASRFFYCAKASKGERNAGLDGFEERAGSSLNLRNDSHARATGQVSAPRANVHPTVKPISLMRYLVRLVTPPEGTVLDPFLGSGTTGCAAVLEGFEFIGIEREPEYLAIAEARIAWWEKHRGDGETADILKAAGVRDEVEASGQLELGEAA